MRYASWVSATPNSLSTARRVFRWDLDKTYLRTEFDTLRELVNIAFESAEDKRTVPGAPQLLRELRGHGEGRVFIVSGSPEQLRRRIEAKLRLDGIVWDSLVLKPQLTSILRGRFRQLKDQLGYKLAVLLDTRAHMPAEQEEYMFGDDAEADAFIYSLHCDIGRGLVDGAELQHLLTIAGVYPDVVARIVRLAERVPRQDFGRKIFIHLDRVSEPKGFLEFGPRVIPIYNYFQAASVLFEENVLSAEGLLRVGADMHLRDGFAGDSLAVSVIDGVRRGILSTEAAQRIHAVVDKADHHMFRVSGGAFALFADELARMLESPTPVRNSLVPAQNDPDRIPYEQLFFRDRARAVAAKLRSLGRLRI